MKKWIRIVRPGDDCLEGINVSDATQLRSDQSNEKIYRFITKHKEWSKLEDILSEHRIEVELFDDFDIKETIIIDLANERILVKEFFFHTVVGRILLEFNNYITYLYIHLKNLMPDLAIDIFEQIDDFLVSRASELSTEEFETIYYLKDRTEQLHAHALYFVTMVHYDDPQRISALEKKIIRDTIGVAQAKKLLGLDDDAYTYIEKKPSLSRESEKEKYYELHNEFDTKKMHFEEYTQNSIVNKSILFWSWWTISPFVSADIAILLPMISEARTIKKIYIDLCMESQEIFQNYIDGKDIPEDTIENEIKKIYPPILKNFQKEALPYLVLLEKMREFSIPIQCFGFNGAQLMEKEPYLTAEKKLLYPVDKEWKKVFLHEYHEMINNEDDEGLTIFLHFMKPMIVFPSSINDDRIEKIIHTDKFTGFGPKKPENSLSIYSSHVSHSSKSFVFPEVSRSTLKDEIIVYFPYMDNEDFPQLDDSSFNKFSLYDTMIYSCQSGGGRGRDTSDSPLPVDAFYQPVM